MFIRKVVLIGHLIPASIYIAIEILRLGRHFVIIKDKELWYLPNTQKIRKHKL